jgi:membrane protease YdiL (CAAX protease family)
MIVGLTDTTTQQRGRGGPGRTEEAVEVAVFLFLIVPSMVLSLFAVRQGNLDFTLVAIATILRDLALVSLVCFFLWRNQEPVLRIGWTFRHAVRELILGVVLFVPLCLGAALLEWALLRAGLSAPATPLPSFLKERGPAEAILAVLLVSVVAVAEETIFRGYLVLRFQAVLRSTTLAVLLSSAIFAVGHGYEGSAGLLTVGLMGVAYAVVYLWRGSLLAPVVMHFLQDFLGIVLLPLLGWK